MSSNNLQRRPVGSQYYLRLSVKQKCTEPLRGREGMKDGTERILAVRRITRSARRRPRHLMFELLRVRDDDALLWEWLSGRAEFFGSGTTESYESTHRRRPA